MGGRVLRGVVSHFLLGVVFLLVPLAALGADAVSLRFDISGYRVEGNTLLKDKDVQSVLAPFRGKQRDFSDVQKALEALELAYRKAGYGAVQVYLPEQELDRGVVNLRVVETRIGKVEVSGNKYFSEDNVRRSLPALQEGATPNSRKIADNLRAANESPVKQARVVLRPAPKDNAVDAKVEVEDQSPWRLFATLDNTGSEQTGRTRVGVGVQYANLFDRDNVATAQYITSPEKPDQVQVYSLGYRLPLYRLGDSMDFFAGYSSVDAGTTQIPAGALQFAGKGQIYGARYNYLFPRKGEYEHKLVFGADYRVYDNACTLGGLANCGAAGNDVRVHPASLAYMGQWNRRADQLSFYGSVARNIPGGTDGGNQAFEAVRPNADASYTILRSGFTYARAFTGDWQVRLRLDGQYTDDALVPGEQFGIGGWSSVRGFFEREIASDYGYAGSVELYTPDFAPKQGFAQGNLRALAFYDAGAVHINHPVGGDIEHQSISSAGVGLRLGFKKNVAVRVDGASVIDEGGSQHKGDWMIHFGVLVSF
jgi:hemolysin activation/secretion protein